jgi:azurin
MKALSRLLLPASVLLFGLTGCGRQQASEAAATAQPSATVNPAPAPAAAVPATTASNEAAAPRQARLIEVQGNDQMKFSVTRIEASPGEELQIKLVNVGTLPKEAMGHNLVVLHKSANPQAYANTAVTARADDYLPKSMQDQVIAATKMLGPKQTDTITFRVPDEPGEYPYLCSFPAHYTAGMRGVIVVR